MHIKNIPSLIFFLIISFVLSACGSNTNEPSRVASATHTIEKIDVSSEDSSIYKVETNTNLKIVLGEDKKNVYLLFSNPNSDVFNVPKNLNLIQQKSVVTQNGLHKVHDFYSNLSYLEHKNDVLLQKKITKTVVPEGNQHTFYMDANATGYKVQATVRQTVSKVSTALGEKSLKVWVEDDSYGSGCLKVTCVTQEMVNLLADKFLKEGQENDIYDWTSNIFGEEWGATEYANTIELDDTIHILLADIDNDNISVGGVMGYFHPKDNIQRRSVSGSNERIMFYIDSVMYANGGSQWNEHSIWVEKTFSTLVHEFQHMIHFYQKTLHYEVKATDIWINEMLSEATEDLLAEKVHINGPRNVSPYRGDAGEVGNINGRYPLFNESNGKSLTSWTGSLEDYSKVSAFGAYLLRNYGGAQLLHDIVNNKFTDEQAILDAVHKHAKGEGKSFDDLIHDWGIAVLLSNKEDLEEESIYVYNRGDFTLTEYNGVVYNLGAINFFNYDSSPQMASSMGEVRSKANYYYQVGEGLTGTVELTLEDISNLNVSVVIVK